MAVAGGFAEHMAAPQDDVGADDLLDHVQDFRIPRQVQEILAAAHTFGIGRTVLAHHMGTDQLLGPHVRVVADQTLQRSTQLRDPFVGQAERRDQVTLLAVLA